MRFESLNLLIFGEKYTSVRLLEGGGSMCAFVEMLFCEIPFECTIAPHNGCTWVFLAVPRCSWLSLNNLGWFCTRLYVLSSILSTVTHFIHFPLCFTLFGTWLYLAVPGCTQQYSTVPGSALVCPGLTWSVSDHQRVVLNIQTYK